MRNVTFEPNPVNPDSGAREALAERGIDIARRNPKVGSGADLSSSLRAP
jgi:hypothetical protein